MRQMSTNVRLRGNHGAGMAVGWLAGLNWRGTKPSRQPVLRVACHCVSVESDPGSVFGLLPPGADAATKP